MLVIMEEKLQNGAWFQVYNEFRSINAALRECESLNTRLGVEKYRACIISDPAEISRIREAIEAHEEEMEAELEREAEFGRELDAQFEAELNEIYPRPDSIYDTPYHW